MERLIEMLGNMLTRECRYQNIYFLVGSTGTGKSTFVKIIQSIIGEGNYSNVSMSELKKDKFAKHHLQGKHANFGGEVNRNSHMDTALLNSISGCDEQYVRPIYGQGFNTKLYATLIYVGNTLPPSDDNTGAFDRRAVVFEFYNTVKEKIPNFENTILDDKEERSGILNLMLEGLMSLQENKGHKSYIPYIKVKQGTDENGKAIYVNKSRYDTITNIEEKFIEEDCELGSDLHIPKYLLMQAYNSFLARNGYNFSANEKMLDKALEGKIIIDRPRTDGNNLMCYIGIDAKKRLREGDGATQGILDDVKEFLPQSDK